MNEVESNNIWQKLKDYYEDDRADYYGACVDDDEIEAAEQELGLRFDESYKILNYMVAGHYQIIRSID